MRRVNILLVLLLTMMFVVVAAPAAATVHPIQSGECSGAGELDPAGGEPPGISDPTRGNIARPLFATGVLVGFDANGDPIIDFTKAALNGGSGTAHCPNAP